MNCCRWPAGVLRAKLENSTRILLARFVNSRAERHPGTDAAKRFQGFTVGHCLAGLKTIENEKNFTIKPIHTKEGEALWLN